MGLRWGIMGTGGIASTMAAALDECGSEVVAVGSPRPGAAAEFAAARGIPISVDSHDGVAALDEVDVVYVATTNDRHLDNVMAGIEAGTPVLCEKPIALSTSQAQRMFDAARAAKVFVMEGMWMRFLPFVDALDQLMSDGAIGEPKDFQATLSFFVNTDDAARRWLSRDLGGGALVDLAIYPLSLSHHLFGPPESTRAAARYAPTGVDLATTVVSTHAGGVIASTTGTFDADTANEAVISGTEGRIRMHAPMHHSPRLTVERRDEVVEEVDTSYSVPGFAFEIAEVERCVSAGLLESPRRPASDTLAVMRWMDEVRGAIGLEFPVAG
jgi:predicted dehydrogenase